MYVDLTDIVDMRTFIKEDSCFNIPISVYSNGSYFGDNDVLNQKNGHRHFTGICQSDCTIYSVKIDVLEECLEKTPHILRTMNRIANEKNNYYQVLQDELALKFKTKRA